MSYWELNEQHRASFAGGMFKFVTVNGGIKLYSFSDNSQRPRKLDKQRQGKYDPMFWMTESNVLDAIRDSKKRPSDVFEFIRQGVALCEDWNSMNYLYILTIPESMIVEAWCGFAKGQPRLSENNEYGVSVDSLLQGGWLQYIIDTNEALLHCISGPIHTGR